MSAIEKLHSEVVDLSGGELRRAAERVIGAIAQLDASTAEPFVALARDLWGGAVICELNGLRVLLDEAQAAVRDTLAEGASWHDLRQVLGEALVVIPGLLDYLVRSRRDNPCLLIPEITAVRTFRNKPPVYEYQVLFGIDWPAFRVGADNLSAAVASEDLKRILHLYQLGLVSVLKGVNRAQGYEILMRSVERLARLAEVGSERDYWTALHGVLENFANGALLLRPDRARLLAAVEKQLRTFAGIRTGPTGNPYPEGLWRAFLALLSLSSGRAGREARLPVPELDFDDAELEAIRVKAFGRDGGQVAWPLDELAARMVRLRSALDLSQEDDLLPPTLVQGMQEDCVAVARRAHEVGLENLVARFERHGDTLQQALDQSRSPTSAELQEYADSILYLDCAIVDFAGSNPDRADLAAWSSRSLDEILQASLLKTARNGVVIGASAVLSKAKALLEVLQDGVLTDEGWEEIEADFLALKACAIMLDDAALEAVFARGWEFLQTSRYHPALGLNDRSRNIEHFADMVVSLEIYLHAVRFGAGESGAALRTARECVSALSF
ncbi:MAG: hypothetical protein AB7I68_01185 [Porticoccaceae bacterium]